MMKANAICFDGICLDQADATLSLYLLAIIISVCYGSDPVKLPLEEICKSFEFQIQTDIWFVFALSDADKARVLIYCISKCS